MSPDDPLEAQLLATLHERGPLSTRALWASLDPVTWLHGETALWATLERLEARRAIWSGLQASAGGGQDRVWWLTRDGAAELRAGD